jgi:hypothetical protein
VTWFSANSAESFPSPCTITREEELHRELQTVKAELASLESEILHFRKENHVSADRFGRMLGCQTSAIGGRATIESEWRALLSRRDVAMGTFAEVLKAWSDSKMEARR